MWIRPACPGSSHYEETDMAILEYLPLLTHHRITAVLKTDVACRRLRCVQPTYIFTPQMSVPQNVVSEENTPFPCSYEDNLCSNIEDLLQSHVSRYQSSV